MKLLLWAFLSQTVPEVDACFFAALKYSGCQYFEITYSTFSRFSEEPFPFISVLLMCGILEYLLFQMGVASGVPIFPKADPSTKARLVLDNLFLFVSRVPLANCGSLWTPSQCHAFKCFKYNTKEYQGIISKFNLSKY